MRKTINDLKIKIFADGADKATMLEMLQLPYIKGFTTNPTLMRQANVSNYRSFAMDILKEIDVLPVSFEVFSDDLSEMYDQAMEINSWAQNVYVKIPITNTDSLPTYELIHKLSSQGVRINLTAVFTFEQIDNAIQSLRDGPDCIISVFAGRIADAGIDPIPHMEKSLDMVSPCTNIELLWASPREVLNVIQADNIGCHIITATDGILRKLTSLGKDLTEFSLDTVKLFRSDALEAGYTI